MFSLEWWTYMSSVGLVNEKSGEEGEDDWNILKKVP